MKATITVLTYPVSVESEVITYEVQGEEVFFTGFEEFRFILHECPLDNPWKKVKYIVTELSSGYRISHGYTIVDALLIATNNLSTVTPEIFKGKIKEALQFVQDLQVADKPKS